MSYPAPILNLNFANSKQLVHPALTFSRASQGSYFDGSGILRYANNSVPRFDHDPLTGICRGLLVEPAVTFLDTYSEQFDNAAWTKGGCSVTANAAIAPDGTTTVDKLTEGTNTGDHVLYRSVSMTSGTPISAIFFAKSAEISEMVLAFSSAAFGGIEQQVTFNLASKSKATKAGTPTAEIVDIGSGVFLCCITATPTVSTSSNVALYLSKSGSTSYTGDGTSGLYIWGAKIYAGTGPTSYLPTVASGVTRAADVCSVDLTKLTRNGSPLWTGTEGTIVVKFYPKNMSANCVVCQIDDNTSNNRVFLLIDSGGSLRQQATINGTYYHNVVGTISYDTKNTIALSFQTSGLTCSLNGSAISTLSLSSLPTGMNNLRIGRDDAFTFTNTISSLTLYNRRIDDAYLPALSTL